MTFLVQLLDRHRDALPDADAHRRQRPAAAALLHAVHRGHRQPRAAHAEGVTQRDGAAMRIDELGILLAAALAHAGNAPPSHRLLTPHPTPPPHLPPTPPHPPPPTLP